MREDPRVTLCFYAEISVSSTNTQHSLSTLNTLPGRRSSTWTPSSWMFLCSERERWCWCWCLCNVWCGVVWCGPPALSGGESGGVGWSRHLPAAATVTPVDSTDCHPVTPSSVRNNFSTSYLLSKQHHQTWPDLSPPLCTAIHCLHRARPSYRCLPAAVLVEPANMPGKGFFSRIFLKESLAVH